MGSPFLLNLLAAGLVTAIVGIVFGLPSLRVKGLYLAIATIAASVILHFVFQHWTTVTGGNNGLSIPPASLFGLELARPGELYWIIVPIMCVMVLGAANLFRTRVGRAFIAIRDRDISAEVLGIPLLRYKLMSFGLSSFYAGVAGGLWAYFFRVVTPESFPFVYSIFFLAAVIVGGMGTILGAILGAIFMTLVPEALKILVVDLDARFPERSGPAGAGAHHRVRGADRWLSGVRAARPCGNLAPHSPLLLSLAIQNLNDTREEMT